MSLGAPAPRFDGYRPSNRAASRIAKSVKRADTLCEALFCRALRRVGARFRKNVAALPGRPDVTIERAKLAIFIDGDFWHGREWRRRRARLAVGSNASYWVAKIRANMIRDRRKSRALRALGWTVVRIWETDVLADPQAAAASAIADGKLALQGAPSRRARAPRRRS